jgi:hypothetical protein
MVEPVTGVELLTVFVMPRSTEGTTGCDGAATVIVYDRVAVVPFCPTWMENGKVPVAVGVPMMLVVATEDEESPSPGGSDPDRTSHVYGEESPPDTTSVVVAYWTVVVPFGSEAGVKVSVSPPPQLPPQVVVATVIVDVAVLLAMFGSVVDADEPTDAVLMTGVPAEAVTRAVISSVVLEFGPMVPIFQTPVEDVYSFGRLDETNVR